jgi:acetylornithine deacetylase/succinyl-diaminopimelate desuccinylase-like protein
MKSISLLALLFASPCYPQDAHKLLVDLIKVDTTNPPGRETVAAHLLADRLSAAGIGSEIFESTPGRGSLVARLKGDGSKRPLILMAHLDVVGNEPARWSVPPFAAVEKDGYLYGRGAIDDKGMAAAAVAVMIEAKRSGLALKRDLILVNEADEESGGRAGIRWLLANRREKLGDAEYALNEGGSTELKDGRVVRVSIQAAEKRYHDVRLTAHGTPGHASIPLRDNAVFRLSAALARLEKWEPEIRLNAVTRTFFTGVAPMRTRRFQDAVKDLLGDSLEKRKAAARVIAEEHPANQAMLMDTVVPTMLSGGIRANVIPSEAWVNLNCRLLPDRDTDAFLADLKAAIDDPTITITAIERPAGAPQGSMPLDYEMYATLSGVSKRLWPAATVLPYMSTGATDSEYLRDLGIKAYGIGLPMDASDEMRMHGDDERISIEGLAQGTRFLYEVVKELNK